jgi:hypothetical protein
LKNLPEAETSFLKTTIVYRDQEKPLVCDIDDFLDCETSECALELFDLYIKEELEVVNRVLIGFYDTKGGKIFIYRVDDEILCLCIHRVDVSCKAMCRDYVE